MRAIKFRAWDGNKMYLPGVLSALLEEHFDFTKGAFLPLEGKKGILMQFTGLHDRTGQEIYEGDIVRNENGSLGEIYYRVERMRFEYRGGWSHPVEGYPNPVKSEVIGNIYENPDLLDQSK